MVNIGNYIYHTWMDCLGKRRFSLVLWFVSTVPLQWNGWEGQQTTTGARYLLFLGFAKGSVRYQLKLEISLVKTTPQTHWYFVLRSNCCANKNPTHRWFLSFINCLDSLVGIPPLNTMKVSFLGFGFSHGKKNVNKNTHPPWEVHTAKRPQRPERIGPCSSSTWRVWRRRAPDWILFGEEKIRQTKTTTWMSRWVC